LLLQEPTLIQYLQAGTAIADWALKQSLQCPKLDNQSWVVYVLELGQQQLLHDVTGDWVPPFTTLAK
jgi:hypothetical protein